MQKGMLYDGTFVNANSDDEIKLGAIYEVQGTVAWEVMAGLPDSWVEYGVADIFAMQRPEFDVVGCELNADGTFRIQVRATHNSPVLIIIVAIGLVGLAILAGMTVERIFEVAFSVPPVGPASGLSSFLTLLTLGGLAAGGIWLFSRYGKSGG